MLKTSLCFLLMLASLSVQAKEWAFDVYLDDKKIGQHTFQLNNATMTSQADFKVKILFIEAYDYHHTAVEKWANNCLVSLKADTTENGDVFDVSGEKAADSFNVSYKQTQVLPACTMTFAYWNPAILKQQQLLNPQNAEYLDTTVSQLGNKTITVKGASVETSHYKILGSLKGEPKLNIEVWYDNNQNWVSLKSTTPEGYNIYYKLK